jgi:hypothetical protein
MSLQFGGDGLGSCGRRNLVSLVSGLSVVSDRYLAAQTALPALETVLGSIGPEVSAEPHLGRVHALVLGVPIGRQLGARQVLSHLGRPVVDAPVVGLFRVDDVTTGFATEDLEGQMVGVSFGTGLVSGRSSLGFRVGLGLTEQVSFDISSPPSVDAIRFRLRLKLQ